MSAAWVISIGEGPEFLVRVPHKLLERAVRLDELSLSFSAAGDCFENDAMSAEISGDGADRIGLEAAGLPAWPNSIRAEKEITWAGRSALLAPKRR